MTKRVALVALAALVVVCGVWYSVFWRAESNKLRAAKQQLQQVSQTVTADDYAVLSLETQAKAAQKEKPVLEKLIGLLPYGPSLDEAYSTITSASMQSGVQLTSVATPTPDGWAGGAAAGAVAATVDGAQTMTITVEVTGPPTAVLSFIGHLDSSKRLYVVTDFTLSGSSGSTSLTVVAFYQSSSGTDPVYPGQQVSAPTTTTVPTGS